MFRYFLKRIGYMLLAVLVISAITFSLLQLAPGNYLDTQRLLEKTMTDATVSAQMKEAWEKFYGLDQPPLQRYANFLVNAVQGEFGPSYKYPTQNIEDIIARTLPISARLALMAIGVALVVGIPLGIIAAIYQNKLLDRIVVFFSMLGSSIPAYVLAVLLSWWLGVSMHLLPVIGWGDSINYVLPIISLALGPIGTVTKYTRSTLVETFNQEYIKVARAKGGNFFQVTFKHALRNSLIPLITVVGPMVATLTVGTVFVENMFAIPGLGQYYASAAINRDYPMVMATTLVFALLVMGMNLLVDFIHAFLDPRVKKSLTQKGG
ncbi:ABC transporter permease [Ruthenibacterium lactatiformans]|uniref:ABC transporter permease n=1 Tax=Ruthenibacterium lactatiformans TaxID=1550024 RepID=UPI00294316ED|nr:ABC transporter permease [Ruthenibacterium lactatiformans]